MKKEFKNRYAEVIHFRISTNEKRRFDRLVAKMQTNKSTFVREKIRELLLTIK